MPVIYDFDKEMDQLVIFLRAQADSLADRIDLRIKQMMASGMSPDAIYGVLRRDLTEGGPLFSGFNQTFKNAAYPMIDNVAQGSVLNLYADENLFEWVTTSAEPCGDCEPRHGQVKPYAEWVELGVPRSGFSVCQENCKCVLLPRGSTGASIADGPVKVKTLAEKRAEFQERLSTDQELQAKLEAYRASLRRRK